MFKLNGDVKPGETIFIDLKGKVHKNMYKGINTNEMDLINVNNMVLTKIAR